MARRLWRTGQMSDAAELAKHNVKVIEKMGIQTLILSCAECYGTFKGFYPRVLDLPFQVFHISEINRHYDSRRPFAVHRTGAAECHLS